MILHPVTESTADPSVKACYDRIKHSLNVSTVPLFFLYIGGFPSYLEYITEQLTHNLKDQRFEKIVDETTEECLSLIHDALSPSDELNEWVAKNAQTPTFYNLQSDLSHILRINIKLCFVFIALRETVKGWAVATKQLPPPLQSNSTGASLQEQFIFDGNNYQDILVQAAHETTLSTASTEMVRASQRSLETNLLSEYLQLCRRNYTELFKTEDCLLARVALEKMILSYLTLLPHLIFSPINIVFDLTSKYPNFHELLYLLSEHFPTFAMQRMMFSGFMIQK